MPAGLSARALGCPPLPTRRPRPAATPLAGPEPYVPPAPLPPPPMRRSVDAGTQADAADAGLWTTDQVAVVLARERKDAAVPEQAAPAAPNAAPSSGAWGTAMAYGPLVTKAVLLGGPLVAQYLRPAAAAAAAEEAPGPYGNFLAI